MTPNSLILWTAVVIYAVAQALIIVQAFRFRGADEAHETRWHGSVRVDLLWTLIPAILLLAVVIYTVRTLGFGLFGAS
ncbi:MAG: cytochrome c oxidase subunit II transmembrane domain-containing protein [Anaerolineae bacterium]